ncbi:his operon leader peptide [Xenorhabdus thailandensis]
MNRIQFNHHHHHPD